MDSLANQEGLEAPPQHTQKHEAEAAAAAPGDIQGACSSSPSASEQIAAHGGTAWCQQGSAVPGHCMGSPSVGQVHVHVAAQHPQQHDAMEWCSSPPSAAPSAASEGTAVGHQQAPHSPPGSSTLAGPPPAGEVWGAGTSSLAPPLPTPSTADAAAAGAPAAAPAGARPLLHPWPQHGCVQAPSPGQSPQALAHGGGSTLPCLATVLPLLQHNDALLAQCQSNMADFKVAENLDVLVSIRDNLVGAMQAMEQQPGLLAAMPPLPVVPNLQLADAFLPPKQAAVVGQPPRTQQQQQPPHWQHLLLQQQQQHEQQQQRQQHQLEQQQQRQQHHLEQQQQRQQHQLQQRQQVHYHHQQQQQQGQQQRPGAPQAPLGSMPPPRSHPGVTVNGTAARAELPDLVPAPPPIYFHVPRGHVSGGQQPPPPLLPPPAAGGYAHGVLAAGPMAPSWVVAHPGSGLFRGRGQPVRPLSGPPPTGALQGLAAPPPGLRPPGLVPPSWAPGHVAGSRLPPRSPMLPAASAAAPAMPPGGWAPS